MSKPSDVSERAWAFACRYQPDDLLPEAVLFKARCALARAFDAATADLRELATGMSAEILAPLHRNDRATLAAYTPEPA